MKRPKSVMIAGHRVKLAYSDLQGEYFGYYSHDTRTIHLDAALDSQALLTTLRHEMIEASLLLSGVGFSENYE